MILLSVKKMVNMVNTCAVTNCASGYTKGLKKAFFHFPEDVELKKKCAAFSKISLRTSVPNLVSLTRASLQILGKTQTWVFPISGFLC